MLEIKNEFILEGDLSVESPVKKTKSGVDLMRLFSVQRRLSPLPLSLPLKEVEWY